MEAFNKQYSCRFKLTHAIGSGGISLSTSEMLSGADWTDKVARIVIAEILR
ncbi:MAG: hypothetical protein QOJ15_5340 [Bradyrhizobium sp.]|nr:hypothetical protein [Bradyrhizobium sp.]